jgi:coiled-coil and C2 domain-containing protein 1
MCIFSPKKQHLFFNIAYLNIHASRCCTDLRDTDLELTVIQGISYAVPNPKDVDTYVKFEFPYPAVSNVLYYF